MGKPLDIFREVNRLVKVHYNNEQSSHLVFLSACHEALAAYFKEYFKGENKDSFIFSALSFSNNGTLHHIDENDDESKDKSYIFNENSVNDWQKLKQELRTYKKQVSDEEMISITKILLDKNNTNTFKDLFFVMDNYSSDVIDNGIIFEYKLTDFNASEENYRNSNKSQLNSFYSEYGEDGDNKPYDRYVWNHHKLAEVYKSHNPNKGFFLHYIKPSIAELDYGLLLSLATNQQLTSDELAFVNLILYRVVSQKVRENIKEAAESLHNISVHVFKTSIKADIIREINTIENETNKNDLATLKNNASQLFVLTGIINLLTKIYSKDDFIKTALNDEILSEENKVWQVNEVVEQYSKRLYKDKRYLILLTDESKSIELSEIKIYEKHFSPTLVQCFLNTILENVEMHGSVQDIGTHEGYYLEISSCENGWIFRNEAKEKFNVDDRKLTGNLLLFKSLFEKTKSGEMEIKCDDSNGKILFELKLKRS